MNYTAVLVSASLLLPMLSACGSVATPTNSVTILPRDCRMLVNEQMPMALDGLVPPNAVISWQANSGSIVSAAPGLNALFFAPVMPAVVTISVSISSGTPSMQIPVTRECIVTPLETPIPPTVEILPTEIIPIDVMPEASPQPAASIIVAPTVAISEVMANPCGPVEVRKWNEYVELYNYGDQPVDVGGWWLADIGESGTPDQLVSWAQRHPHRPLNGPLILNSTVIPPRSFAVILSPGYMDGVYPYAMPFRFPQNTVMLTAASSRSLGDDYFNIIGDGQSLDVLVLYKGGVSVIHEVISTYGTPRLDVYVASIRDDHLDNLPRDLHECSSIERIDPAGGDHFENWREINNGSPGEAPYR